MIEPGTPYSALLARLAHDPALPLLTDVDLSTGDRVELSVMSAANGAAKAAHLVAGVAAELGRPPIIALDLPLHWQVVTFALGAWASGARLVGGPVERDQEVDAVLLGAGALVHLPDDLPDTVWATRLHPFGLPLTPAPAYPVEDLTTALRQQPDAAPRDRGADDVVCLVVPGAPAAASTMAELMARARSLAVGLDRDDRVLTTLPLTATDGWVAASVLPFLAGHSVVLVRGEGADDSSRTAEELSSTLERLCATERVAATCGIDVPGLPRLA